MSIYKRKEIWWIQFTDPLGRRVQQSTGTKIKQEAQELHDKLKSDSWRQKNIGIVEHYTWKQAVVRWLTEMVDKRSINDDKRILRWLNPYLCDKNLDDITSKLISNLIFKRQQSGAANATVNRTLAVIRAILNRAKNEWEWIQTVPKIKALPEPKIRIRWLTHADADRLLTELPPHLHAMTKFTLATGLRESNVVNLKWSDIDMQRKCAWIHGDEAKGKKNIAVPLNTDAIAVIKSQVGNHFEFVFTYKGKPVTGCNNTAWKSALKRAGIVNFRWHDLRHTWASWHVQAGTPLNVLQELGGWSDYSMVQRYAHLSADHLIAYANNVSTNREKHIVTDLLHYENSRNI